jgi:N-acetylmuramoyl-L-alanine amidase
MAIKVYIDQGHNPSSYNTGAEGNGYFEQDITFRVGILLNNLFETNPNFQTRLSRPTSDTLLGTSNSSSLVARVRDANTWGADIFLSLHTNASINPSANGSECLIYSLESTVAYQLSEKILEQMTLITGLKNRGIVERPGLYVLRRTVMPAVVIEMGFITNSSDAELLANSPNLFARGIYRGVLQYYGLF